MKPSIEKGYTIVGWPSSTEQKAVSLSAWPTSLKGESEGTLKCYKNSASAAAAKLAQLQFEHVVAAISLRASLCGLSTATTLVYFLLKNKFAGHCIEILTRSGTRAAAAITLNTKAGTCTA